MRCNVMQCIAFRNLGACSRSINSFIVCVGHSNRNVCFCLSLFVCVSVCVVPASSACAVSGWLRTNTIQLRVPYVRCRERNAELQRAHRIVEPCVHQTQPNPTQPKLHRTEPNRTGPKPTKSIEPNRVFHCDLRQASFRQ